LVLELEEEAIRMKNEWFFKWHQIGRNSAVVIDSFKGRPIQYGGIKFSGTARLVYWDTIQRYLRKKISAVLDDIESQITQYPPEIRKRTLEEVKSPIFAFIQDIRSTAIEKDRILRGDGMRFPAAQDRGHWERCSRGFVQNQLSVLKEIYCADELSIGSKTMPIAGLLNEKFTFVKKDGTTRKDEVMGRLTDNLIITQDVSLSVEPNDHFLRNLPNGLVEDYVVLDPGYYAQVASLPAHYQCKVRRTDLEPEKPQTVINNIHANFSGANARLNVNSVDNSTNYSVTGISITALTKFLHEVDLVYSALPREQQDSLREPIALLKEESQSEEPSTSKIRSALQTVVDIAKGASGNLVAAGITELASSLLAGG